MVSDTLFVLLDIEKEEEASDKVEREDGSTIIMGTAGFAAFGCSTSGYGYSPPSATLA